MRDGKLGKEEKSPIHIADIVKICGMSNLSIREEPGPAKKTRGILLRGVSTTGDALESRTRSREEKGGFPKRIKIRFDLQELDHQSGHDESRRRAGVADISSVNSKSSDSARCKVARQEPQNERRCDAGHYSVIF